MSAGKYNVESLGQIEISDKDYLGAGGEASIYVKDKMAVKIYHSPSQMIPVQKIQELKNISDPNVLIPKHIVFKGSSVPVGYVMEYKPNTHPLCKLFTKSFKDRNNIENKTIDDLVSQMQSTISNIHKASCLCVDLNEMNELVSPRFAKVYFIDVDSYQTPSYKATAIMDSIKDRSIKGCKWTEGSDWFSFAILAFQMWIGIHPYKGKHPDYSPNEWMKRMDDGISVFDPKVVLPRVCNDISTIPKSHFNWMKDVFVNGARCQPPSLSNYVTILVPASFKFISANKIFDVKMIESCPENIKDVFNFMGINYLVGETKIYKGKAIMPVDIKNYQKVIMCESNGIDPVICTLNNNKVEFHELSGNIFGSINSQNMMSRNGCLYTTYNGQLIENSFVKMSDKLLHVTRVSASVMDLSTQVFDGVVIQNILGKIYATIPYKKGLCSNVALPDLNGYRIIGAKCDKNVCVIMTEKNGKYSRFILTFDERYITFTTRVTNDVSYSDVNLTVLPNGVAVLANDSDVEIFKDKNVKTIDNPPFDSTKKIFNISGVIHYIDGKEIYVAKINN